MNSQNSSIFSFYKDVISREDSHDPETWEKGLFVLKFDVTTCFISTMSKKCNNVFKSANLFYGIAD